MKQLTGASDAEHNGSLYQPAAESDAVHKDYLQILVPVFGSTV